MEDSTIFVDVPNRVLTLYGPITSDNCNEAIHNLLVMDRESQDPIQIILNSEGGDSEQALAVGSIIQGLESKVRVHAVGTCMSAAPWILAAGTGMRTASETCIFMTHFGEWEIGNKGKNQLSAWEDYEKIITKIWFETMAKWTNQTPKFWEGMSKDKDYYFTAETALECNLIDRIEENLVYKI
jgi:ATP-dependent protease ClpP protease subunit